MDKAKLVRKAVAACKRDDYSGYCVKCGAHRGNCEPDAREYECPKCHENAVYGAEEIVMMWGF